ncbi:chymotrypsin B-like [Brachionus plicatilis]|uniref:Chymotrypsin B-like n=1 Tax=Brachionus plicatilis TaxID=10195 RepID=A0A3M7RZ50_BRAPC|nr:chymotrypsin B-like [Brachionus plicatilis]
MNSFQIVQQPAKKSRRLFVYIVCGVIVAVTFLAIILAVIPLNSEPECDPNDFKTNNFTQSRIINGQEAVPHSYPWLVSIRYYNYGHICGGSIIHKRWILTAGHCVKKYQVSSGAYQIIVGLHDRNEYDFSNVYNVIEAYSEFNEFNIFSKDIALLKLDRDIVFNKNVALIKLSESESKNFIGKCLVTAGWGSISKTFEQKLPNKLQQTFVRVIDDDQKCRIENKWNKESVFCVKSSSKNPYSMTCSGDSGGPLVSFNSKTNTWFLEGVTSYVVAEVSYDSKTRCLYKRPGFFSKVYSNRYYILNILNNY